MASPFRVFRRYQKTLLVVAGVVLMFVFVIGDSLVPYLSGGNDREVGLAPHATAVSWNGGKLTNADLDMLRPRRRIVMEFLRTIEYMGRIPYLEAGNEPPPLRVEMLNLAELPEQNVEQDIVRASVLSQAAREAGMVVTDDNIRQYLEELGRGNVSPDDMRALIARMQGAGSGVNVDFIFDALREELLARNYLVSYQFAFATVTPEQRWQDWLRLNDRVVIEAAAFPVDQFIVDVPQPTPEELAEFYELYKNREPQPDVVGAMEFPSRFPAFAIPRKVNLKYLVANYDKFLEKIKAEVTDEEIEKYYEEKKDPLFIKTDTGLFETEESEDASPPGETKTTETEGEATESTEAAESADTATDTSEAAESTDTSAESADKRAEEAADGPSTEETDATEETAAPAPDDSSNSERGARKSVFRLAAFQQDADETEAPAGGANDAESETGASNDGTPDTSVEAAPANDEAAPADNSATDDAAADTRTTPESATDDDAPGAAAAEEPLEFQPLEEVREEIRRQIAEERVAERLIQSMDDLHGQLKNEFNKYFKAVLDAEEEDKQRPAPPAALDDLESLAPQHGLEAGETGSMSGLDLLKNHPVGGSVKAESGEEAASRERLVALIFSDELELYEPVLTVDIDGNRYVAMVTEDVKGRVPPLDEIRKEVVSAWKRQEAAVLAEKHAKEVAKQAQLTGAQLGEFFADQQSVEVVKTDPFSELTGGSVSPLTGRPQPVRWDEPEGIVAAGPEFLRKVFELGENEVGAMLNHDHSIAYVVKVVEHEATPEELHQDYLAEANTWDGISMMTTSRFLTAQREVVGDLLAAAEVKEERPLDQPPTVEAEEE